ncbi:unnamed protein product [Effrenium voratum]|nr:unnamed protein product [Effrenium voratum]
MRQSDGHTFTMSFMPRHGISALLAALSGSLTSAGYPEADESHVQRLLAKMTTEEKLLQTCIDSQCPESRARWLRCDPGGGGGVAGGGDAWFNMEDLPRVGIRGMRMRDGPKGMTCQGGSGAFSAPCPADGTSPSFPSQVTRAASWSTELEEEIGQAIGDIAATLDIHAALLPTINILPWLNWGRAQERATAKIRSSAGRWGPPLSVASRRTRRSWPPRSISWPTTSRTPGGGSAQRWMRRLCTMCISGLGPLWSLTLRLSW